MKFRKASLPGRVHPGWLVLLPSIAIIALVLILTPAQSASADPSVLTGVVVQQDQPLAQAQQVVCQSCHPKEYDAWKNTPHAQSAGASCEACHGPYKEGHPDKTTMQLPMASDTCKTCHTATFAEWQESKHADKNIECFDCHNAHSQGLRTESEEKLCAACHSERQTEVTHATHGISGVNCAGCHMTPETQGDGKTASSKPTMGTLRSHAFTVASDVCAKCHEDTIHTSNQVASLRQEVKALDPSGAQQQAERLPQLEQENSNLRKQIGSMRDASAVTMGLSFGFGGFLGLLGGVAGVTLAKRRNS